MALAHGYALPFEALRRTGVLSQNTADATNRATADGATKEAAGSCLDARALEVQQRTVVQPSILVVPQLTRNGVVLNQLPNTRTNFIQNNTMVGATGSVRPNLWDLGSLPSGFTISYSASGQTTAADGTLVDYIDVTVSGTALASGFLNLRQTTSPSPVSGNLLFAAGMTYTASVYLALLSGSLTGLGTNSMSLQEYANNVFIDQTNFAPFTGITSALTRFTGTRTMTGASSADRTSIRWGHSIVSGTSYDYTVRIASPQLEKGSIATPVIRTASGFVTVDAGGTARDGAPPDFTFTRDTTATRVNASGLIESVASGVLRLDYPITGGCPAALIEPSAQNVVLQSQNWLASGWRSDAAGNVTTVTGTSGTLDPLGTNTANAISPTSGSTVHLKVGSDGSASFTSGTIYTQSAFFKQGTGAAGRYVQLTLAASTFTQLGYANFDLQLGTVAVVSGTSADTNRAASIENYGNGWYRCRFTATCDAGGTTNGFIYPLIEASGDTRAPSFTGVTGDVLYGWGAQVETGAIPTSYIPTTTASATRNADVCSVSNVSGYIGQTEGTIYLDTSKLMNATLERFFSIYSSTSPTSDNIAISKTTSNTIIFGIRKNTVLSTYTANFSGTVEKLACAFSAVSGGVAIYVNGTQLLIDTNSGSFASVLDEVYIGRLRPSISTDNLYDGRIRAAALYTTRLTNDQLASLTRLT